MDSISPYCWRATLTQRATKKIDRKNQNPGFTIVLFVVSFFFVFTTHCGPAFSVMKHETDLFVWDN